MFMVVKNLCECTGYVHVFICCFCMVGVAEGNLESGVRDEVRSERDDE